MDLRETGHDSVEWFHLAQDRDNWRSRLTMVILFRVHKIRGGSSQAKALFASEGLWPKSQ